MAFLKKKYKINRNRPTVGITGPDKGGEVAWLFTALGVLLAGGWPVHITPSRPRTADGLQALIIGGGADVDPDTYQERKVLEEYLQETINDRRRSMFHRIRRLIQWVYFPALFFLRKLFSRRKGWTIDRRRDHLEFQLIDQAVKKRLPVLGICRGSQLINVYFQGTLHQEISPFYQEEPNPYSIFPVKKVQVKPGSKLAEILGVEELHVNALHHQAVKEPGQNVDIVAWELNNIVQGIENHSRSFIIGVQWHPEYLPQFRRQRRLFHELVRQAKEVQSQIEEKDMQEALARPMNKELERFEQQEEALMNQMSRRR